MAMETRLPYSPPLSSCVDRQMHLRLFKLQPPKSPLTFCPTHSLGGVQYSPSSGLERSGNSFTNKTCSSKTHHPTPSDTSCSSIGQATDLIDMLTEDPLSMSTQHAYTKQQSSKLEAKSPLTPVSPVGVSNGKRKVRQMDILSFLDSGSNKYTHTALSPDCEDVTEHTPISQGTDSSLYTNSASSRTLFQSVQLSPESLEPSVPLKSFGSTTERKRKRAEGRESYAKSKSSKVNKRRKKENLEQLHLDCGQKQFGHVTCKVCGMVYTHGQVDDQTEHLRFHKKFITGINFPGWKKERLISEFEYGRIIAVFPSDPKHQLRKVEDIRTLVDIELGYAEGTNLSKKNYQVFLCISQRKKLMGCIFAEEISRGFAVLTDGTKAFDNMSALFCSTIPQPAVVGINRLWVSSSCRRMGVASKLLDTVRLNVLPGVLIPKNKVAFSDPTPDGKMFAAHYCEQTNFLVYR